METSPASKLIRSISSKYTRNKTLLSIGRNTYGVIGKNWREGKTRQSRSTVNEQEPYQLTEENRQLKALIEELPPSLLSFNIFYKCKK
jgi:hypothetical protein